jgi:hypothetical protein
MLNADVATIIVNNRMNNRYIKNGKKPQQSVEAFCFSRLSVGWTVL